MDLEAITPEIARELELPRGQGGAMVTNVDRNGAAAAGGIQPGDVILEVNRTPVTSLTQVTRELERVEEGTPLFMTVWREGQSQFLILRKR